MSFDHRSERGSDRLAALRRPLGTVACGRGLRRARLTHRDLVREYDDWMENHFDRRSDANEHGP